METEQKTMLTSSCYRPKCKTLRLLRQKDFRMRFIFLMLKEVFSLQLQSRQLAGELLLKLYIQQSAKEVFFYQEFYTVPLGML